MGNYFCFFYGFFADVVARKLMLTMILLRKLHQKRTQSGSRCYCCCCGCSCCVQLTMVMVPKHQPCSDSSSTSCTHTGSNTSADTTHTGSTQRLHRLPHHAYTSAYTGSHTSTTPFLLLLLLLQYI